MINSNKVIYCNKEIIYLHDFEVVPLQISDSGVNSFKLGVLGVVVDQKLADKESFAAHEI
jgi:hypothetical protein